MATIPQDPIELALLAQFLGPFTAELLAAGLTVTTRIDSADRPATVICNAYRRDVDPQILKSVSFAVSMVELRHLRFPVGEFAAERAAYIIRAHEGDR